MKTSDWLHMDENIQLIYTWIKLRLEYSTISFFSYILVFEHNGDVLYKNHVLTLKLPSKCTTKTASC